MDWLRCGARETVGCRDDEPRGLEGTTEERLAEERLLDEEYRLLDEALDRLLDELRVDTRGLDGAGDERLTVGRRLGEVYREFDDVDDERLLETVREGARGALV